MHVPQGVTRPPGMLYYYYYYYCYILYSNIILLFTSTTNSDEDLTFFKTLPQHPCFFVLCFFLIDQKEWQKLRTYQEGHRFKGLQWRNVISKGIHSVNPYCSFGFRRHRVKIKGSTIKGPFLQSTGNLKGRCHFPWKRGLPLSKRTPKKAYLCWCLHWHRTHTGKEASKDTLFGVSLEF